MSAAGPASILAALVTHEVDFVVIGGLAAIAHGSRRMTRDIDIVVRPDDENLSRLEAALAELGRPKLLKVIASPAGAAPYADLKARSIATPVAGVEVRTSGLDDLVAMKRAAGRPLDLQDIADITAQGP